LGKSPHTQDWKGSDEPLDQTVVLHQWINILGEENLLQEEGEELIAAY